MARIRSIKPEFWDSESIGKRLPGPDGRQARLLFIALWNHAEDHGVCRAAPALLRSVAFPYDEDVTTADVSRWLGMLEAGRFIVRYERDGSSYLWVRAFDEHQKIDRKSKTTLPEPSNQEKQSGVPRIQPVASTRRALDEHSLQEGKGGEGKGEDTSLSAGADEPEELPDATDDAQPVTERMTSAIAGMPEAAREEFALTAQDAGPKAPKLSAAQKLYAALEASREGRCAEVGLPFIAQGWDVRRINSTFSTLTKVPKGQPLGTNGKPEPTEEQTRFQGAWDEYLADEDGAKREPPWSLGWFLSGGVKARYETRAMRAQQEAS